MARFLLDRSLGQHALVTRLRAAGWDAVSLAEQFGDTRAQSMRDEEWIGAGAKLGYVLLAKDHKIATRPLEAHAIYHHDARVIVFARGDLTAAQMGDACLGHSRKIHQVALARGPVCLLDYRAWARPEASKRSMTDRQGDRPIGRVSRRNVLVRKRRRVPGRARAPFVWRRMGDSNPRGLAPNTLSKRAP